MSNRPPGGGQGKPIADAGVGDASAGIPSDYKSSFKKMNHARFMSVGHASQRWDVDVYANDVAARVMETHARETPVGAVIVAEHFERPNGEPGPVMIMEKKSKGFNADHGDWRYASVGASGTPVRDVTSCAACHDDAPADGLFPVIN